MTTDEVLEEVAQRGLTIVLGEAGKPVLRGDKTAVTPSLVAVLRWHRDAILERLGGLPEYEWLWIDGHRFTAVPISRDWHPVGAWWYRRVGEKPWCAVPGCPVPPPPRSWSEEDAATGCEISHPIQGVYK